MHVSQLRLSSYSNFEELGVRLKIAYSWVSCCGAGLLQYLTQAATNHPKKPKSCNAAASSTDGEANAGVSAGSPNKQSASSSSAECKGGQNDKSSTEGSAAVWKELQASVIENAQVFHVCKI